CQHRIGVRYSPTCSCLGNGAVFHHDFPRFEPVVPGPADVRQGRLAMAGRKPVGVEYVHSVLPDDAPPWLPVRSPVDPLAWRSPADLRPCHSGAGAAHRSPTDRWRRPARRIREPGVVAAGHDDGEGGIAILRRIDERASVTTLVRDPASALGARSLLSV